MTLHYATPRKNQIKLKQSSFPTSATHKHIDRGHRQTARFIMTRVCPGFSLVIYDQWPLNASNWKHPRKSFLSRADDDKKGQGERLTDWRSEYKFNSISTAKKRKKDSVSFFFFFSYLSLEYLNWVYVIRKRNRSEIGKVSFWHWMASDDTYQVRKESRRKYLSETKRMPVRLFEQRKKSVQLLFGNISEYERYLLLFIVNTK